MVSFCRERGAATFDRRLAQRGCRQHGCVRQPVRAPRPRTGRDAGAGRVCGSPPAAVDGAGGRFAKCCDRPAPRCLLPPAPAVSGPELLQWQQRQYGVAWQYRPNRNTAWAIYFSRLARDGTLVFPVPVPVPAPARDVPVIVDAANDATDPQLVWHSDGYGLAWLHQPVAGGRRALMFTVFGRARGAGRFELWRGSRPPGAAVCGERRRRRCTGLRTNAEWAYVSGDLDGKTRRQDPSYADGPGRAAEAWPAGLRSCL